MGAIARLALDDDTLYIQKGDSLAKWEMDGTPEGAFSDVATPHGVEDWVRTAREKWGLVRVIDKTGKFDPEVDLPFPKISYRTLASGEPVAMLG